jgi:subtilisin family serine protease
MAMSCRICSLVLLAGICGSDGFRVTKNSKSNVKHLAGVPMFNADRVQMSRDGSADFIVMAEKKEVSNLCSAAGKACVSMGHPNEGGVAYVKFHGREQDLATVLQRAPGAAKFVEPDLPTEIPENELPQAEEKERDSSENILLWGLSRVGRGERPNSGKGAHVYVLDTGIRTTHNDFEGRAVPTLDMTTGGAVECNGDQECANDKQGHGTHCSGTVAGVTYGVAPETTVYAVKVLSDSGSGQFSWSIGALDFVMTKGQKPAVASMSLGGKGVVASIGTTIDEATARGVVVSVAAGNSRDDACGYSPAYVPTAITVGSTNVLNTMSIFSNYGSCTNIWAPGSQIISCGVSTDWMAKPLDGTSMACPHVSGGAAIVLTAEPNLTPRQVLEKLHANAEDDKIWGLGDDDTNKLLWVGARE